METKTKRKRRTKKDKDYVSNKELTAGIINWQNNCGDIRKIDRKIIDQIYKIINNYANKYSFRGYRYLDDMKSDALFHCIKGLFKFKKHKSENAFSFLTQTTHNAFIQAIAKEKKQFQISFDLSSEVLKDSHKFDFRDNSMKNKKQH